VILLTLVLAAQAIAAAQAKADAPDWTRDCQFLLEVQFDPDVPDTRNPGFLGSLANRPGYSLVWLGESRENMTVMIELYGSGPDYLCYQEIERMGRDARVLDIKVLPTDNLRLAAQ
jgi:hypothetical protein